MSQGTAQKGVQPVSATALPLPTGASTEATLAAIKAKTDNLDVLLSTRTKPADTQAISGSVSVSSAPTTAVTGPLTDTQLRASAVPVSGTFFQATQPVSIAATLPVSGPLTDAQLRASAVPVSGPLTDTQIRATPLPISGTVTVSDGSGLLSVDDGAGSLTIDAPVGTPAFVRLSDGAAAITTLPVSLATNTPDVTDRAGRLLGVTTNANMDVALSTRLKPADTLAAVTAVGSITGALPAGTNLIGQAAVPAATLSVTAVSAANAAVTATLPAVAAQFHYISRIVIERVATTAIVGSAVLTYTSTNLPGSWTRTTGNAAPVGVQQKDVDEVLGSELRSSAVNTNTTIVAPAAGATGIVRITVYYRAAA